MNLDERIARRRRAESEPRLVRDYDALNPAVHLEEPTGRGPLLERLLDHLEPVFRGGIPPSLYVWGPKGTGKSAILSALFDHLSAQTSHTHGAILTTTRAGSPPPTEFVYVDARAAPSQFSLARTVLDSVSEESIPKHGVGTDDLRDRLEAWFRPDRKLVVAVDHVDEPETYPAETVSAFTSSVEGSLAWVVAGRGDPASVAVAPDETVQVAPYERHALVDILTHRSSLGLSRRALSHERIRTVAEWADGDAHDALAAVFGAADAAAEDRRESIRDADIEAGMDAVPWQSVSLGRVLSLSETRQRVLYELLALPDDAGRSVTETAEEIAAAETVDLSASTVTRMLYELAEAGIVRRVTAETNGQGRPPSRVEPQFPTRVFRRLYALTH